MGRAAAQADADRGISRCLISRAGAGAKQARARKHGRRISDQAVTITIQRGAETLDAQTVRIEFGDSAREDLDLRRGLNVVPGVQRVVVFGVRNHPTVADTDIQRGDRFVVGATEFEVIGVISAPGEVQAICEATDVSPSPRAELCSLPLSHASEERGTKEAKEWQSVRRYGTCWRGMGRWRRC